MPPALRRAMDFGNMPPWKRRLLRPNWGAISNAFFGTACICFVVSGWPPLQDVERLVLLGCSGPRLSDWANLAGSALFLVEPIFDFMAVWVECWDDILWTAREEQSNPGAQSASSDGPSGDGAGVPLQSSRQSSAVGALMMRKLHFWGAVMFGAGSLLYFWWALLPFTGTSGSWSWQGADAGDDTCYDCKHTPGAAVMYFECVDEAGASLKNGRGECNLPWLGSVVFVLSAVVALVAWLVYRDETADFIGFKRSLCSCRVERLDWGGWAAILFAIGASLDCSNNFAWDSYPAEPWVELCASLCWLADWFLYMLDQQQLDQYGELRELPQIAKVGDVGGIEWVVDKVYAKHDEICIKNDEKR